VDTGSVSTDVRVEKVAGTMHGNNTSSDHCHLHSHALIQLEREGIGALPGQAQVNTVPTQFLHIWPLVRERLCHLFRCRQKEGVAGQAGQRQLRHMPWAMLGHPAGAQG
jgi:hypothetical protein